MVVADTGVVLALLDRGDRHHAELRRSFDAARGQWVLPWAVLPEADYLIDWPQTSRRWTCGISAPSA